MSKFSERLKETLRLKGMSQSELAKRIKLTQSTINSYCTGRSKPSIKVLVLICKTVERNANYLLGLVD